jgi:hypothetical protein
VTVPRRTRLLAAAASGLGRALLRLPGIAAVGCAVTGTFLLVAAAFLLAIDLRMP